MYYDITNPDVSYYWLNEALRIKRNEFNLKLVQFCVKILPQNL